MGTFKVGTPNDKVQKALADLVLLNPELTPQAMRLLIEVYSWAATDTLNNLTQHLGAVKDK